MTAPACPPPPAAPCPSLLQPAPRPPRLALTFPLPQPAPCPGLLPCPSLPRPDPACPLPQPALTCPLPRPAPVCPPAPCLPRPAAPLPAGAPHLSGLFLQITGTMEEGGDQINGAGVMGVVDGACLLVVGRLRHPQDDDSRVTTPLCSFASSQRLLTSTEFSARYFHKFS